MMKLANVMNPRRCGRLCATIGAIGTGFRKVRTDRTGGVTTVLALSLPAVIGFAGLGTEAANWYLTRRDIHCPELLGFLGVSRLRDSAGKPEFDLCSGHQDAGSRRFGRLVSGRRGG